MNPPYQYVYTYMKDNNKVEGSSCLITTCKGMHDTKSLDTCMDVWREIVPPTTAAAEAEQDHAQLDTHSERAGKKAGRATDFVLFGFINVVFWWPFTLLVAQ